MRSSISVDSATPQLALKVFISFSRRDMDFVDELAQGLRLIGFDVLIDKTDIAPGEPWEVRLSSLIEQSDTVVFVLSPASAASERCAWEIGKSVALSKRLLPVVIGDVEEAGVPDSLKRLNYIFFKDRTRFSSSLKTLADALRTDLSWFREQTRMTQLAVAWDRSGRDQARLLGAAELENAKAWMGARPYGAPEITALQLDFIKASEEAEAGRLIDERRASEERARAQGRERELEARLESLQDALNRRSQVATTELLVRKRNQKGRIFISYRREDTAPWAGWLYERLLRDFHHRRLFMDVQTIQRGRDFMRVLDEHLAHTGVMLVLIGKNWLEVADSDGNRRLDDPEDLVRREIATALERDIAVIPVLIEDTTMPKLDDLPNELRPLVRRQAAKIAHVTFQSDIVGLKDDVQAYLAGDHRWSYALAGATAITAAGLIAYVMRDASLLAWLRALVR